MKLRASLWKRHRVGLLIAVAVVVSVAVPLLIGGRQSIAQIRELPGDTYLVLFAIIATSWLARALKLHLLLGRLGAHVFFPRTFAMSLAIDFAFMSTPGGVGGYAASVYCSRRAGVSLSAATTVTFMDQFLDLAFFTLALPLAALSLAWTNFSRTLMLLAVGASVLVVVLVVLAVVMHQRFLRWLCGDNYFARRWPRLRERQHRLHAFVENMKADSRVLLSGPPGTTALLLASTALQWLTRYGVLWATLAVLGHAVPFALTLLSQSLILHAAMWTGVPAGGGGAELGLTAALLAMVPSSIIATALILWRLTTFHLCLVAGAAAIAWLARWDGSHVRIDAGAEHKMVDADA
jgi:uncharacterized protein (TIRG00374 family)